CEFGKRGDGISEIEGKAATVAASEQGRERVSNSCLKSVSEKNFNSDDHFDRSFRALPQWKPNNQKERKNNETIDPLQKNKNSSEHIPQSWRDLRVSHRRSRTESLRLSSSPSIARNPRIHARWDAEYLRFGVVVPPRGGL